MNSATTLSGLPGDIMTGCKMTDTVNLRIFVNRTLLFTFIFTFIFLNCSNAQNEQINNQQPTPNIIQQSSWTGAYMNLAGTNITDGVEVFSQLGKCKSEDVVFLKLINHNDYDVKVELLGGVYTKDRQWIKDTGGRKSITISAKEEMIVDCSNLSGDTMTDVLMVFIIEVFDPN